MNDPQTSPVPDRETSMPIYLVNISLQAAGHDYTSLWRAMENAQGQRLMDTSWLVDVANGVEDATRAILSHLGVNDRLFLLEFRPDIPWSGTGLDQETKEWLQARISGIRVGLDAPPQSVESRETPDVTPVADDEKKRKKDRKRKAGKHRKVA